MTIPFFDLKRQYSKIATEINAAICKVEESSQFILGENVKELEKEVAAFSGVKYGIGVASGTDALHLSLRAVGIKERDEVITTPFTFVATAEAISYIGAKPVFADIDPRTFNIDPLKIEEKIGEKTKAIIPVHLYGQPVDLGPILDIAKKYNLKVIEDSAQAIGAEYKGRKVCSFGAAGCLSFFPTKNLGCFGDGGMVLTNDEEIAERVKVLRAHGSRESYHYDIIGFNSRLDELQAAILRVKLKYLETWNNARRENASLYNKLLSGLTSVSIPPESKNVKHVFHQYTIRTKDRDKLFGSLKSDGIGAMVYYPISLHLQKVFSHLGGKRGDLPLAEKAQEEVLSLPIFPELKREEIEIVAEAILNFFA